MIKLRPLTLRNKILFFSALLVLIPGTLLGLLAEKNARSSLQRVIGRELAREADHVSNRLTEALRAEAENLESFSRQAFMREIRVDDLDKRIAGALNTLQAGSPSRAGYLVVNAEGMVIAATNPTWMKMFPAWAEREIFSRAIAGPAPNPAGVDGILLATPIPDPDRPDQALGTLLGMLHWSLLVDILDSVRDELDAHGLSAELAIANQSGAVLRRSLAVERPSASLKLLGALANGGALEPDFIVHADHEWISGRASAAMGAENWQVLVVEPLSHALAPATRLRHRLIITIAIALAVALLLAAYGARRVVEPLSELTTGIRGLTSGKSKGLTIPVHSEDEVGTLATAFNIMNTELDRTQTRLIEAEKFALVGQLAAGIAHEVRTSLSVLRSSAQILERSMQSESEPETLEMVDMIGEEVHRLSGVVDDLLTLDHQRPLDLRPTPLSSPLRAAIDFVSPRAREAGIEIAYSALGQDPTVLIDADAIQQVSINLLSNAISALTKGRRIDVCTEQTSLSEASFTITDNGDGIPRELRERIFEPFVTGRETGVGLGLTAVKRIIHEHQGTVTLEEQPEQGARFRVTLPLTERRAEPRAETMSEEVAERMPERVSEEVSEKVPQKVPEAKR